VSEIRSAVATPCESRCRTAHLRPPLLGLPTECFATGTSASEDSDDPRATSLYTSAAVGAPDPVTSEVPTPYPSTGAAPSAAIEYSSRSPVSRIRVFSAPSESSRTRTSRASTGRSPLSIRTAPRSGPASDTAVRTARATSYVSTSSVVAFPSDASWDSKACRSLSCTSVNACADVPVDGTPYDNRACRFDVAANPARYAARAAATAARSCVRRDPISINGRSPAAVTIRDAAEAIAQSWFRIDRHTVSSRTASANVPETTSMGEPGK
jgi:hypothetical protein